MHMGPLKGIQGNIQRGNIMDTPPPPNPNFNPNPNPNF